MATTVPTSELELLVRLMLQNFNQQYRKNIQRNTVNFQFIPPRDYTRIGFEVNTILNGVYLKLRLYAMAFTTAPFIKPYRLEEVQDDQITGYGDEVYVSITELPLGMFPVLAQTLNPIAGSDAGPFAIQLEDLSGFIELENGGYMEQQH